MPSKKLYGKERKFLYTAVNNDRVVNAYLFLGNDSLAKTVAAIDFAKYLNCLKRQNNDYCSQCESCLRIAQSVFVDLIWVDNNENQIKIDQIREVKSLVKYGPSQGGWMLVVINAQAGFTVEAANSLLKVLEEPPAKVVFIILAGNEEVLPKTIISRCQSMNFEKNQIEQSNLTELVIEVEKMASLDMLNTLEYIENYYDLDRSEIQAIIEKSILLYRQKLVESMDDAKQVDYFNSVIKRMSETLKNVGRRANMKLQLDLLGLDLRSLSECHKN